MLAKIGVAFLILLAGMILGIIIEIKTIPEPK